MPDYSAAITGLAECQNDRADTGKRVDLHAAKARSAVQAARYDYIPNVGLFLRYTHQNGVPFLPANNGVVGLLKARWICPAFMVKHAKIL
jgi:hypothetical protein